MTWLSVFIIIVIFFNHKCSIADFVGLQLIVFTLSLLILHIDEFITVVIFELLVLILGHHVLDIRIWVCCSHLFNFDFWLLLTLSVNSNLKI